MPKMPVTSVGGISSAVSTESTLIVVVALLLDLQMELFLQQPAALAHLDDGVIEAIEALRELAGAEPQGGLQIVDDASARTGGTRSAGLTIAGAGGRRCAAGGRGSGADPPRCPTAPVPRPHRAPAPRDRRCRSMVSATCSTIVSSSAAALRCDAPASSARRVASTAHSA